jgi:tetratricopeptide (TPR) repeat protein
MSKPMLVTLPFVLLLLDVWPLGRVASDKWRVTRFRIPVPQPSTFNHLLFEKWPFFTLTVFSSALTFWIQKTHAAVVPLRNLGLAARLENATLSYTCYLARFFWPAKLAVIYPYPKSFDGGEALLAALLLLAISIFCMLQVSRRPYLAVGWFWFLGTLIPVIGLVQVGEQAMADRYTYLPLIGPVISLVWLAAELFHSRKMLLSGAAILVLAGCAVLTSRQLQSWRNSIALFEHAIAVTTDNPAAQFRLGSALEFEGRLHEAMFHYLMAMKMNPLDYRAYYCLANCLEGEGRWAAAVAVYRAGIALGAKPDDYVMHLNFAAAWSHLERAPEAVYQLNEALRVKPDSPEALNNLAWLLATGSDARVRNGARAVQLAERACQLTDYRQTLFVGTLAAAYAEAGRFDDATATAEKAIALAEKNHEPELLQKNRELLELYRAHKPCRDAAGRDPLEPPVVNHSSSDGPRPGRSAA